MKNLNLFRKSARVSEGSTLASAVVRPSFDRRSTVVKHLTFMLLFLLAGVGQVWGADYVKTAAGSVKTGDVVIITYDNGTLYAMTNDNGASSAPSATEVTATNDVITTEATNILWDVTVSDGSFTFKPHDDAEKALYCTATNNGVRVGTNANKVFTVDAESGYLKNTATSRYVGCYNSQDFRCYTSINNNIKNQTPAFYVLQEGGGDTPSTPTCAKPTFSPAAGSYEGTQNITISSTEGATIYYTTDGSDPSTSSSVYSSPIAVSASQTIKAYAVKADYEDSEVAEAAYVITEGPDVTLNLIDGNWGFPTSNTTEDATYTNSVTGYSVTCHAPTQYKDATTYFFIGKSGAYIILPEFANPVEKIVVVGNSGGSGSVVFNIYDGETAVSTAATGCGTDKTFEIENPEANKQYTLKVTSAHNLQLKAIKIFFGAAPAVAKPMISGEENFVGSTSVSISHADADHIYYTTNGDAPTTSSAVYSAPFPLTNTATVKAIAVKGSDVSAVAEKTFTKVEALESLAALLDATTSTETAFNVVISNWVVTGVSGSRAWIADAANEKGILLYKSGHNFVAGNKLNGVVLGTKTKLYQGYPELTTLLASDVTVTTAEAITPRTTTIAALTSGYNKEQGTVVKLENLTYTASSSSFSDGENTLALNTQLYNPSMVDGGIYTMTGVVRYDNEAAISIMPRSADDVEQTGGGGLPEVDGLAALKAEATGASYLLTLTDAIVTLVDGNNAFIEDATAGALIYFSGHGYAAGDKLNGQYEVTTATYQGKFEITAMEAQAGATKEANAEIPVTTLTIAQLNANFAANESKRIKIVGVNVTDAVESGDATARTGAISDGANTITLYAGKSGVTAAENANIDVIGYPTYHNTDQQLAVWAQVDITVNEKDPAGIAFDPASATITAGDAWSAPDFANPNSLDVTFSSDDESVATVSNAGVVALAGGYGTAVITAHTDGDATHNAGNATYTVTVNDPASVDTRKVANSPATFTTTNGNLNPADITYASYQGGSSTAPAIYNDGIRLYQIGGSNDFGGFVTITAKTGCTIDEVQITTTSKYATTVAYSVDGNENLLKSESVAASSSYTTGTGLNVSSVNILNVGTGSSGRLEIASIKVYYTGEAATIHHYDLGGTYQTAFMQDEEFNHTGLIVYAVYDALGENKVDITSSCSFSKPDMSTTGEKTIEITYNEAVVISYTINVAADSRKVANSPATFTTVSGDMTPNDITFASNQGGASTAPANYNDGIRLYQAPSADAIGGFITLKAKKGCTIDQVKITTTNTYATTVAYSVDGNENLLGSESVAKSSDYSTPSGLNVESVNIVNKGTGSSGRLEIASIKVWYTGDALAVDHYILGGTYATEFEQYGEFNYEGLTVTAAYDAGETITEAVVGFTVEADLSTAGNKKADVMLNSVKIAEYDITVTASAKEDPALAYSPASVVLTFGQSLSAPTFSNTHNVSPITYSSDKESVATVDAEGNIALAGGCGTAVITASFAGDDDYIDSEATFTITVNEAGEDLTGTWVLATAVPAVGQKFIVAGTYNDVTKTMGGMGSTGNNRVAVTSTLESNVLTPGEGTKVFTLLDAGDNKFAIKASNGKYLSASGTGTKNYLTEAATYEEDNAKWTISVDGEGTASVIASSNNRNDMQYNKSGEGLFACYATNGQTAIQLYVQQSVEPVLDWVEVRSDLEKNRYYTVCLPKKVTAIKGASFWTLNSKSQDGATAYLEEETNNLPFAAGKPFIIQATAAQLEVIYEGDATDVAGTNGALHGTLDYMDAAALAAAGSDVYMLYSNELRPVGENNHLDANRAYVKLSELNVVSSAPLGAPGRRVRAMPMAPQVATGVDQVQSNQVQSTKVLINGQLFILRGEKMYNANGQLVK